MNIIGQDIRFKLRLSSNISKMLMSLVCWKTQIINLNRQIVSDLSELRLKEFRVIIDDMINKIQEDQSKFKEIKLFYYLLCR